MMYIVCMFCRYECVYGHDVIVMTQTMQDQSSKDVWPSFQSNDCTHDPRWQDYVFTTETHT